MLNIMITQNNRYVYILFSVLALLLIPLISMQYTNEVNWNLADFFVMGILLLGVGALFELVLRRFQKLNQRIALFAIIVLGFLIVWAELAVGIFGSAFAGS